MASAISSRARETVEDIRSDALAMGFDLCRITEASLPGVVSDRLHAFIGAGYHGSMEWLASTCDRRAHPQAMWPEARSAVVLGMNYGPALDPLANLEKRSNATISVYARNRDYHDLIKGKLKLVAQKLAKRTPCNLKVFVDTAPLMEKPLAEQAGIGWQGKHTNLVSREFGSWLFLGVILTDLEFPPDGPESDHCGSCRACLDICPTDAFPAPYQLDARRCISYLTIEHAGPIPVDFRKAMGNRIYGCDDCLAVCPWNKFAQATRQNKLAQRGDLESPPLDELATLDDPAFRRLFSGSPIKRIGISRFLRNVLIAIGNSADSELMSSVLKHLENEDPVIRGAAIWAAGELSSEDVFLGLAKQYGNGEKDPTVRLEWQRADPAGG